MNIKLLVRRLCFVALSVCLSGCGSNFSGRKATPMKPSDRMLDGSVGKDLRCATALQLVKKGKIGLDDRIEKYLGHEPQVSRLR